MFALTKEDERESPAGQTEGQEQISAADYDPSLDRREDEERRVRGIRQEDEEMEEVEEVDEDDDDLDDMFAIPDPNKKKKKTVLKKKTSKAPAVSLAALPTLDAAADPEGYYQITLGELLDGGRYQVFSSLGKGMFSNVVRARIMTGEPSEVGREVAIKIVRAQESMLVQPLRSYRNRY